jgi:hypothetical protein
MSVRAAVIAVSEEMKTRSEVKRSCKNEEDEGQWAVS